MFARGYLGIAEVVLLPTVDVVFRPMPKTTAVEVTVTVEEGTAVVSVTVIVSLAIGNSVLGALDLLSRD